MSNAMRAARVAVRGLVCAASLLALAGALKRRIASPLRAALMGLSAPVLALCGGLATMTDASGHDAAAGPGVSQRQTAEAQQALTNSTNEFLQQFKQYRSASAAERERGLGLLKAIAERRRQYLESLIATNPREVLLKALSSSVRSQVPSALQDLVEEHVELEGRLRVIHLDKPQPEFLYSLKDARGSVYTLRFADQPRRALRSDTRVRVKGVRVNRDVALLADGGLVVAYADGTTTSGASTLAAPMIGGDQPTLVIVGDFLDKKTECPADFVRGAMFTNTNSVDKLYREASFGNVSVSGTVVGPYTLPYTAASGVCDLDAFARSAESAAQASGVNLGNYTRRVYVLPSYYPGCGAAGAGTIGGSPSQAWVWSSCLPDVYAHELGHNLGMAHSSSVSSQGTSVEYGDNSDFMGTGQGKLRHTNAPHKIAGGWLPPERVLTVTGSGTYTIEQLEFPASGPQALKIAKPDTNEFYFLSYRLPIGFDSTIPCCGYTGTTSVHRHSGSLGANTHLVSNLADGASFTDSVNGITVTQLSRTASAATVAVNFGYASCVRNKPLIAVSPLNQTAAPGTTLRYQISVTNQNSPACSTGSFLLSQALPSGLGGVMTPTVLSIDPAKSATATWDVTSNSFVPDATYTITATAADAADATRSASANASNTVLGNTCVRANPGVALSPSSLTGAAGATLQYRVVVTNNNGAGCSAATFSLSGTVPGSWSGSFSPSSLSLNSATSTTALFNVNSPASAGAGTYTVTARAADAADGTKYGAASGSALVVAGDTTAPSVSITEPLNGGALARKSKLTVAASATDNVGVTKVEFYVNGSLVAADTSSPYSFTWTAPGSVRGKSYQFQAKAYDAANNASTSSIVTLWGN